MEDKEIIAQWRLVDINTGVVLATMGGPINVSRDVAEIEWQRQLKGTGTDKSIGILGNKTCGDAK